MFYSVCHSFYIFWRHYFNVKLNCFILRTTKVAGLGVPIFRVIYDNCSYVVWSDSPFLALLAKNLLRQFLYDH